MESTSSLHASLSATIITSFRMEFPLVFFNQNFQEKENSRVIGGRSLTFRLLGVDGEIVCILSKTVWGVFNARC